MTGADSPDDSDKYQLYPRTPEMTPERPFAGDRWSPSESSRLGPLGLLNGEYEIRSFALNEWPDLYPEHEFNLILCLDQKSLWGAYDFGMFWGIMYLPQRPYRASYDKMPFESRGRERGEGEISFGPGNEGWIQFLGDGRIEGEINCYGRARFSGKRVSGLETRTTRDSWSMQDEWMRYNESEYERARVNRWH